MTRRILLALGALFITSCGGGSNSLHCGLKDQTTLASSDWPSLRHDSANTAHTEIFVGAGAPEVRCLFPRLANATDCLAADVNASPIDTSVVVGNDNRLLFVTRDGDFHFLMPDGTPIDLPNTITLMSGAKTPLFGEDGNFYVSSGDGGVRRFAMNGDLEATGALPGFIAAAPVMDGEGIVYVGSVSGAFAAVCPNGGLRFNLAVAPTRSVAAVTTDALDKKGRALILTGSDSGRVRAVRYDGDFRWSFTASTQILSAIVIDETRNAFFVSDHAGRIYSGNLMDGTGLSTFRAARCSMSDELRCDTDDDCPNGEQCLGETISASAALGGARLYVATEGNGLAGGSSPGRLYALDLDANGAIAAQSAWEFPLPGAGRILSSPVVAPSCDGDLVIFGADLDQCDGQGDGCGTVFAVDETGLRWAVALDGFIGTVSPTIRNAGSAGVVYIGTDKGRVYEIDPAQACPADA